MSKEKIVFKDRYGNTVIKCDHIETGKAKLTDKAIKIYGSSRVTPAIGFDYPEYGTKLLAEKLESDHVLNVNVSIERYEDLVVEINEDNELVVKIGKVKIGGCK